MDGRRQRHPATGQLLRVDQHLVRIQRFGDGGGQVALKLSDTLRIARVDWLDPRAVALREAMNVEMDELYADSSIPPSGQPLPEGMFDVDPDEVTVTLLALEGGRPAGHAALRPHEGSLEVKKVFVDAAHRGHGIARTLMESLEAVALERGIHTLVLQTGDLQLDAIRLYERLGYRPIAPFRNYGLLARGLCFAKSLPVA